MNDDKTEFIVFGSRKLQPKCVTTNVRVGNVEVERTSCIKLLGIHTHGSKSYFQGQYCQKVSNCFLCNVQSEKALSLY